MKRVRFRHTVWMKAEFPLSLWHRVRLLFGAPLAVQLTMPTERSPGVTGQVSGMIRVGRQEQPKGTIDAAAEPGGPGAGESGDGAGRA
jgi:hypothetical protein